MEKICISTLTHAAIKRGMFLEETIKSVADNLNYDKKIDWYILSNGIDEEMQESINKIKKLYKDKIRWHITISDINLGVGAGINKLNELTINYKYNLFIEGDWILIPNDISGHSKNWFSNCINLLDKNKEIDQIQLRRYLDDLDNRQYGYGDWIRHENIKKEINNGDEFLILKKRSYTNPPSIRRSQSLINKGIFPLKEYFDKKGNPLELKGNKEWGQAEIEAGKHKDINTAWLKFGNFVHLDDWHLKNNWEILKENPNLGCHKYNTGYSGCKYGLMFPQPYFCSVCELNETLYDFDNHNARYESQLIPLIFAKAEETTINRKIKFIVKNPTINIEKNVIYNRDCPPLYQRGKNLKLKN